MNYLIQVNAQPYVQQGAHTALQFCRALLEKKHQISLIFFYHNGVFNGHSRIEPPADYENIQQGWQQLARAHGLELIICVDAAAVRGVSTDNLASYFQLGSLAQLAQAISTCDRNILF